jgi:hypothetical protein
MRLRCAHARLPGAPLTEVNFMQVYHKAFYNQAHVQQLQETGYTQALKRCSFGHNVIQVCTAVALHFMGLSDLIPNDGTNIGGIEDVRLQEWKRWWPQS